MARKPVAAEPSLEALLDHEITALDRLLGDVRAGVRGARHFDELEERAQAIGKNVPAAFRTSRRAGHLS